MQQQQQRPALTSLDTRRGSGPRVHLNKGHFSHKTQVNQNLCYFVISFLFEHVFLKKTKLVARCINLFLNICTEIYLFTYMLDNKLMRRIINTDLKLQAR